MQDITLKVKVEGDKAIFQLSKATKDAAQSTKTLDDAQKKQKKTQDEVYTRMTQGAVQTANSTKNFSKLQQATDGGGGAGGLVRAYALLAANVFALTAAFGVLSRSAQIDTLNESMELLSVRGGTFIRSVAKEMQAASGFAIDLAQSFRQVSLASSAGLSTKEIEGLTTVARGAAISLGRNLPDAMDRIFRGAIKLEPEILDEIGLFVRVDEAAQKYARNNGKVVSALTQTEKRQAFLNEILEQGTKKFEEYATAIDTDPYAKLGAALGDIAQDALSLANNILGPVVGLLAEVKGLLIVGFAGLVTFLLSKAIPAMGLFAQSQAQQASAAAKSAKEYTDGLREATQVQIDEENKQTKKVIEELEKRRQAKLRFDPDEAKGPKSRAEGAKKIDERLKRNEKGQKRINALKLKEDQLEKQIARSNEKNSKLLEKDLRNIRKEKRNLEEQLKLEKQIADNQERGRKAVNARSLAFARQRQLDMRAGTAGVIASAVQEGELQTYGEGIKKMNEGIAEGFKTIGKDGKEVTKQFGFMSKAGIHLKTRFGLIGNSINKLMISLQPFMLAFSILLPIFIAIGKGLGFMSKESRAFDEEIKKSTDLMETFSERSEKQREGMKDTELSFLENVKAQLAFSKSQAQVSQQLLDINDRLEKFKEESTDAVKAWEGFKKIFGLDRETKAIEQSLDMLQEQINEYVKAGDDTLAQLLLGDGDLETFKSVTQQLEALSKVRNDLTQTDLFGTLGENAQGFVEQINKGYGDLIEDIFFALTKEGLPGVDKYIDKIDTLSDEEKERLKVLTKLKLVTSGLLKENTLLGVSTDNLLEKTQDAIEAETERTRRLSNFVSAVEGAAESVGKFQQSFLPKTKVDDILSSLDQMKVSLEELGEEFVTKEGAVTVDKLIDAEGFKKFFSEFEKDNPISQLFTKEQIDNIKLWSENTDGGLEKAIESFNTIIERVTKYQKVLITSAIEVKRLTDENKNLNKVISTGVEAGERFVLNSIDLAKEKVKQTQTELDMNLMANKLTDEMAVKVRDVVAATQTRAELERELFKLGLGQTTVFSISGAVEKARLAVLEQTITERNKENLIIQQNLKAQQKQFAIEKELIEVKEEGLKIEQKLFSMSRRGTLATTTEQDTEAAIKAAENTLKVASQEAQFKRDSAVIEAKILQMRMTVMAEELRVLDARAQIGAFIAQQQGDTALAAALRLESFNLGADIRRLDAYEEGFNEIIAGQNSILQETLKNIAGQFAIDLFEAMNSAASKGLVPGIKAGVDIIGAISTEKGSESLKAIEKLAQARRDKMQANADRMREGGDIEGAEALEGRIANVTTQTEQAALRQSAAFGMMRNAALSYAESLKQFGPEGEFASAILMGSMAMTDAFTVMADEIDKGATGMAKAAEVAQFVGVAIQSVGSILAANAKNQTASIDEQIEAEKRRDGKSKESIEKIKQMEKKKEAINRKAFEQQKKIQIASTIANTAAAIMQVMSAPGDFYKAYGIPMSIMLGALGAAQVAIIARQKYNGGSSADVPATPTELTIGKRNNNVDVSRAATRGELSYLRGQRTAGGGAMGKKGYFTGGEGVLVGERGPEVIRPSVPVDITPNDKIGSRVSNVNFTINAVDATGVQELLVEQRGNIIEMIREAANETGEMFLEDVDTQAMGGSGGGYG